MERLDLCLLFLRYPLINKVLNDLILYKNKALVAQPVFVLDVALSKGNAVY